MRKLTIRPQARLDLLEIWHHIAANGGIDAANRMGEKLEAAILNLRSWPGMGHARADVKKPGYTFWSVKPYVIVYVYDDKLLRVLRVMHGHRDFRRLFR
jgi:plasmid stabilization system protein ParE